MLVASGLKSVFRLPSSTLHGVTSLRLALPQLLILCRCHVGNDLNFSQFDDYSR